MLEYNPDELIAMTAIVHHDNHHYSIINTALHYIVVLYYIVSIVFIAITDGVSSLSEANPSDWVSTIQTMVDRSFVMV